jgi:D-xylose transport system permease protein
MKPLAQTEIDVTLPETADVVAKTEADWKRFFSLREMGVYYALFLLVAIISSLTTYMGGMNYLSVVNLTNVLYQSSLTGIMAVAMTVILITGNFDLSVASVAALAAAVLIGTADFLGFWPSVCLAMLIAASAGLLNGAIVQFVGINAFIVTLGTMTALRGVVLLYTNGYSLSVQDSHVIATMKAFEGGRHNVGLLILAAGLLLFAFGVLRLLQTPVAGSRLKPAALGMMLGGACLLGFSWATGAKLVVPNPVVFMAAFAGVVWFVLNFTIVGRRVYAVGGNPEAARLSGINVIRYKLLAFVLSSASAGFAGVLFASRLRSMNPAGLTGAELTVIAASILGGTSLFGGAGSVVKTLAGTLLLYSLTNGFNILNLGANYQGLIEGVVVVGAAAIYTVGGYRRNPKAR